MNSGGHNFNHLLSDHLLVGRFQVAGCFDLVWCLLGESNCEQSNNISIGGFGLNETFDKGVPFLNHLAGMISGDIKTVEVGVAIKSLNFLNLELNFSMGVGVLVLSSFVVIAIS